MSAKGTGRSPARRRLLLALQAAGVRCIAGGATRGREWLAFEHRGRAHRVDVPRRESGRALANALAEIRRATRQP